jgi:LytS/YehU family sensor histidine kinase
MVDWINGLCAWPNLMVFGEWVIVQQLPQADVQSIVSKQIIDAQDAQVQRTVLLALVPVVVAFSFIVFVFYRARREAFFKQSEAELKLNIARGELKALRAQINPHFIFNCLNSIHHYMHGADAVRAGDYLIKFSQLIRHVLESSEQRMVPLADEVEANRIYIQLEQLRMNQAFTYEITCDAALDPEKIQIPPMLIQPFVENAIWHGLTTGGTLQLYFNNHDDQHLSCIITDSGSATTTKPDVDLSHAVKKTSLGMALMHERFDTLNQVSGAKASFTVSDRTDGFAGKQVTLIIPYED